MARSNEVVDAPGEVLADMTKALSASDVRLELGFAFSVGGSLQVVRIFRRESYTTKGGNWRERHVQVGPMLVAPEDAPTRAGLLRQIADMLEAANA